MQLLECITALPSEVPDCMNDTTLHVIVMLTRRRFYDDRSVGLNAPLLHKVYCSSDLTEPHQLYLCHPIII